MRIKRRYKFWSSLYALIPAILLAGLIGALSQSAITAQATTQELQGSQEQLIRENQALRDKLEASAKIATPEATKAVVRMYLKKYFGSDISKVEKVFTCESNLNPLSVNTKTGDYGVAQINKYWHKERFEKMFGVRFEVGVYDIDLNVRYAKFLYDNSGLNPWVCAKLV